MASVSTMQIGGLNSCSLSGQQNQIGSCILRDIARCDDSRFRGRFAALSGSAVVLPMCASAPAHIWMHAHGLVLELHPSRFRRGLATVINATGLKAIPAARANADNSRPARLAPTEVEERHYFGLHRARQADWAYIAPPIPIPPPLPLQKRRNPAMLAHFA